MSESNQHRRPPVVKATAKAIESLQPEEDGKIRYKFFSDGLAVRVLPPTTPRDGKKPRSRKTLYFYYNGENGRKFIRLGTFRKKEELPKVGYLTLEEANRKIEELVIQINNGSLTKEESQPECPFKNMLIDDLIKDYLAFTESPKNRAPKTHNDNKYVLEGIVLPEWTGRKASEIRKADAKELVNRVLTGKRGHNAEGMVRSVIKIGSAMYNWKFKDLEEKIYQNPFQRVKEMEEVENIIGTTKKEDRYLADKEIITLWNTLNDSNGPGCSSTARALLLTLVTCQRPGEVAGMHRGELKEFDLIEGMSVEKGACWWVIPWQRIKTRRRKRGKQNKKDHLVYLSPLAMRIVGNREGFIFPSPVKEGEPILEKTMSQLALDDNSETYLGVEEKWTPNDLRKTGRTLLSRLKCPNDLAERIINHSFGEVEGIYNLFEYAPEKKEWLTNLSDFLEELVKSSGEKDAADKIRQTDEKYDVEELRRLVASMPLTEVAKALGVSDNAIKKRCVKHNIDLHSRGHWIRTENRNYGNADT